MPPDYPAFGNYLRVRGEYRGSRGVHLGYWELPPRARRILHHINFAGLQTRTTSACAENTLLSVSATESAWNYLRVRGEYASFRKRYRECLELPPRARRILVENMLGLSRYGTTSACAENTSPRMIGVGSPRNYLRVRGEYEQFTAQNLINLELPPRARRIQAVENRNQHHIGTTSACAENTGTAPCTS